jgi:hypothetical protein
LLFLRLEIRRLADEISIVIAGPARQPAAVEFDDTGGQLAQERAVVRDEEKRHLRLQQIALQPQDRIEIEMVRRLIEHEDIGLPGQGARQ